MSAKPNPPQRRQPPSCGQAVLQSGRDRTPVVAPGGNSGNPLVLVALILLALGAYFFAQHGGDGLAGVEDAVREAIPDRADAAAARPTQPAAAQAPAADEEAATDAPARAMIPCSMLGRWNVRVGSRDLGDIDLKADGRFDFNGDDGGWSVIAYQGRHAIAWDYGRFSSRPNEINPLHGGQGPDHFSLTETDGNTTDWQRVGSDTARYCDAWDFSTAG